MLYYTLKRLGDTEKIVSCKPKGSSAKNLPTTTDNSLAPSIKWYGNSYFCLVFRGCSLKQNNNNNNKKKKQCNLYSS